MGVELLGPSEAAEWRTRPLTYTGSLEGDATVPSGYPYFTRTRSLPRSADFASAAQALMTWQVQSRSGLRVQASSLEVQKDAVVVLTLGIGRVGVGIPCRVVHVVDEPDRRGFSYGSLPGHPESGEESFLLQRHEDASITFTVSAFSRAASPLARLGGPPHQADATIHDPPVPARSGPQLTGPPPAASRESRPPLHRDETPLEYRARHAPDRA